MAPDKALRSPVHRRPVAFTVRLWATAVVAMALLIYAFWSFASSSAGVVVERQKMGTTPLTVFRESGRTPGAPRPVVVIAHGFAGSQQLMTSIATTLARNGYLAVTFDFEGHGRHLDALAGDVTEIEGATASLVAQLDAVADHALSLPGASGELAVVGHSMASDIAVRFSNARSDVAATVTLSMFSPAVTATSPDNLLVVTGEYEKYLRDEALRIARLVDPSAAEGQTLVGAGGVTRRVAVADGVEHIGVLYSADSLAETLTWLNGVFARDSRGYLDHRGLAIVALLIGTVLLAWPLSRQLPRVVGTPAGAGLNWRRLIPVSLAPAVLTPLVLVAFPADFFGVLVGGYVAVHFFVYGLIMALGLLVSGALGRAPSEEGAGRRLFVAVLLSVGYAAAVFALVMDRTVTSFAITPLRLPLVFLMLAGTLTYFLADEWATRGPSALRGGSVFTRLCFLLSLGTAVALSPQDLFFLLIIAAVIVIYFVIYGLFSRWAYRATGHPAVGAITSAVAFAWALAAVFPIMSGAG